MTETPGAPVPGPKLAPRARIERAAATLFYRRGIHATGVELVAQRAEVSKRTLYQHFAAKTDLVAGYLRNLDTAGGTAIERLLDAPGASARDRLLRLFDTPAVRGVFRGCPFHNAAVESAGALPEVDAVVRAHKRTFAERLTALAGQTGAADPDLLGAQLAVLFDGATALATSLDDPAPFAAARAAAATLIDGADRAFHRPARG